MSEKRNGVNEGESENAKPQRKPEDPKRKTRCAFTGHRPQFLKRPEDDVRVELENAIMAAIREGFTTFITGGAYGVDLWAAEIVTRLRERNPALHLIAAIPFPGFEEKWTEEWKQRYNAMLVAADFVVFMEEKYSRQAYQTRNEWMVSHAARLIAVYNGEPSGTRNTIYFARKIRVNVRTIKG